MESQIPKPPYVRTRNYRLICFWISAVYFFTLVYLSLYGAHSKARMMFPADYWFEKMTFLVFLVSVILMISFGFFKNEFIRHYRLLFIMSVVFGISLLTFLIGNRNLGLYWAVERGNEEEMVCEKIIFNARMKQGCKDASALQDYEVTPRRYEEVLIEIMRDGWVLIESENPLADSEYPEIGDCGSGYAAVCSVGFEKGELQFSLYVEKISGYWMVVGDSND